jgi:hypothetical protein
VQVAQPSITVCHDVQEAEEGDMAVGHQLRP